MFSPECSIGNFLNDACNKLTWTNNIGVYTKDDLSQIDLKLIELRCGVNIIVHARYHHSEFYLNKYTMRQCCNPCCNVAIHLKFTRKLQKVSYCCIENLSFYGKHR